MQFYVRAFDYERTLPRVVRGIRRRVWQGTEIPQEYKAAFDEVQPSMGELSSTFR